VDRFVWMRYPFKGVFGKLLVFFVCFSVCECFFINFTVGTLIAYLITYLFSWHSIANRKRFLPILVMIQRPIRPPRPPSWIWFPDKRFDRSKPFFHRTGVSPIDIGPFRLRSRLRSELGLDQFLIYQWSCTPAIANSKESFVYPCTTNTIS
jgi:hypothetical protein